ncbi:hypothetical protein P6F26_12385 [Roseibacterium sp. SDUM158017]|uniref:hypothetical protein n=1 Tax=Roseicyclus salinarum TaxID=3036773 RepID=UPI002415937C|nr:hypothetical protein [Roseibacterium sp. SDUM158017]MDG4649245.1 hypothetical protein [Roseibacterium sp. SDUM158017]
MTWRGENAVRLIERLMHEQRAALRAGRLEDLGRLVPRFERALRDLGPGVGQHALARLRSLAAENAALLIAARAGLARARDRRDGAAAASLSTYDARGRSASTAPTGGRILSRR